MTRFLDRPDDSGDAVLDGMRRPRQPYPKPKPVPRPQQPSERVASRRVAQNRQVFVISALLGVVALTAPLSIALMVKL